MFSNIVGPKCCDGIHVIQARGLISNTMFRNHYWFSYLATSIFRASSNTQFVYGQCTMQSYNSFQPLVICFWKYFWKECFNSLVGVPNAYFWQKCYHASKTSIVILRWYFHPTQRRSRLSSVLIQIQIITCISFDYL